MQNNEMMLRADMQRCNFFGPAPKELGKPASMRWESKEMQILLKLIRWNGRFNALRVWLEHLIIIISRKTFRARTTMKQKKFLQKDL